MPDFNSLTDFRKDGWGNFVRFGGSGINCSRILSLMELCPWYLGHDRNCRVGSVCWMRNKLRWRRRGEAILLYPRHTLMEAWSILQQGSIVLIVVWHDGDGLRRMQHSRSSCITDQRPMRSAWYCFVTGEINYSQYIRPDLLWIEAHKTSVIVFKGDSTPVRKGCKGANAFL